MRRTLVAASTAVIAAALALGSPLGAAAADFEGELADNEAQLTARREAAAERSARPANSAVELSQQQRIDPCNSSATLLSTIAGGPCRADILLATVPNCGGQDALPPLWRRERATPSAPWSEWQPIAGWSCPADVLPALTLEDFRRLPLAPPTLAVQPDVDTVLINVPTITYAQAPDQTLTTDLLGYTVEVRAAAGSYTWDYGDGTTPVTTTSPGHPYPDHDIDHTYATPGTYRITLNATWTGEYRIPGVTDWTSIPGTATTSATSDPLAVVEARTALVAGTCTTPDC